SSKASADCHCVARPEPMPTPGSEPNGLSGPEMEAMGTAWATPVSPKARIRTPAPGNKSDRTSFEPPTHITLLLGGAPRRAGPRTLRYGELVRKKGFSPAVPRRRPG